MCAFWFSYLIVGSVESFVFESQVALLGDRLRASLYSGLFLGFTVSSCLDKHFFDLLTGCVLDLLFLFLLRNQTSCFCLGSSCLSCLLSLNFEIEILHSFAIDNDLCGRERWCDGKNLIAIPESALTFWDSIGIFLDIKIDSWCDKFWLPILDILHDLPVLYLGCGSGLSFLAVNLTREIDLISHSEFQLWQMLHEDMQLVLDLEQGVLSGVRQKLSYVVKIWMELIIARLLLI